MIIVLKNSQLIDGHWREAGEVISVDDNFETNNIKKGLDHKSIGVMKLEKKKNESK